MIVALVVTWLFWLVAAGVAALVTHMWVPVLIFPVVLSAVFYFLGQHVADETLRLVAIAIHAALAVLLVGGWAYFARRNREYRRR